MNDDTAQRSFTISVAGDTADEIELAALDKAREFFGPDVQLKLARNYGVTIIGATNPFAASGKKYCAMVRIDVES